MSGHPSSSSQVYQYLRRGRDWYVRPVTVTSAFAAELAQSGPCVYVHPSADWRRDTRESLYDLTEGAEEWLDPETA